MKNLSLILITALLDCVSAISINTVRPTIPIDRRTADTCADPSLTVVWVQVFNSAETTHGLGPRSVFVTADSLGDIDQIQSEAFLAWETPQNFTVPFFQLHDPTINDTIYLTSTNGNPPTVSGYTSQGIVGYVYSTQVCGSVPLLAAFLTTAGDHWYTTSVTEHSSFLAKGWTDAGVAGFVLPLNCHSEVNPA